MKGKDLKIMKAIALLGTALATGLFFIKLKIQYAIIVVTIFAVVIFAAWYITHKFSNKMESEMHQVNVYNICHDYINELQEKFSEVDFKRIEKVDGIYVTNSNNKSTSNDARIFRETQVKRVLRSSLSPLIPQATKSKLSYFSQEEDKDKSKIYQLDDVQYLQPEEKYAIQNMSHATLLIQVSGFNILTDPVFYDLHNLLYPAKTASHPSIKELPRIDVIV